MKTIFDKLGTVARRFVCEEAGPTAAEYAVLLALIILVAVAAIQGIGSRIHVIYQNIDSAVPTG